MEFSGAVAGEAGPFAGVVELAMPAAPDSAGPFLRDGEDDFFAGSEVEAAVSRCGLAGASENSRPHAFGAVVY